MKILRSPDSLAASLPDYPFAPHHVSVPDGGGGTLGVHVVDEGPRDAPPVVFFGDVEAGGEWDRVGIVCYPSRRAFMEMQNRPDFQARYVHKEAGMERTIVAGALPESAPAGSVPSGGRVVFEMVGSDTPLQRPATARLRVEGPIVGDGRRFATLGVSWIGDAVVADAPGPERVVTVVVRPRIDRLASHLG